MITLEAVTVTKERSSKALGSMMALLTLVKILNSSERGDHNRKTRGRTR